MYKFLALLALSSLILGILFAELLEISLPLFLAFILSVIILNNYNTCTQIFRQIKRKLLTIFR